MFFKIVLYVRATLYPHYTAYFSACQYIIFIFNNLTFREIVLYVLDVFLHMWYDRRNLESTSSLQHLR